MVAVGGILPITKTRMGLIFIFAHLFAISSWHAFKSTIDHWSSPPTSLVVEKSYAPFVPSCHRNFHCILPDGNMSIQVGVVPPSIVSELGLSQKKTQLLNIGPFAMGFFTAFIRWTCRWNTTWMVLFHLYSYHLAYLIASAASTCHSCASDPKRWQKSSFMPWFLPSYNHSSLWHHSGWKLYFCKIVHVPVCGSQASPFWVHEWCKQTHRRRAHVKVDPRGRPGLVWLDGGWSWQTALSFGRSRREQLASKAAQLAKNICDLFTWSVVHLVHFLTDYVFYIPEKYIIVSEGEQDWPYAIYSYIRPVVLV